METDAASVIEPMDPLPSPWHLYGLASSPYAEVGDRDDDRPFLPTRAIVGRETDVRALRTGIHQAGQSSSIQCAIGPAGVGRTTLVRALKAALAADGYLAADVQAVIAPGDSIEVVLGRILGALHDTILVNRPEVAGHGAMRAAARLILAARLGAYEEAGSEHDALARFRAERRRRLPALRDVALLDDIPAALAALAHLARFDGDRGIVLHLRIAEHATTAARTATDDMLHALRAPMLEPAGLHYVLTGTPDTIGAILNADAHARSSPAIHVVAPLPLAAVRELLVRRYMRARLAEDRRVIPPVADDVVAVLHALFRGDLHGVLAALHDGVGAMLGLAGSGERGAEPGEDAMPSSLTWHELGPMLQARYAARLAALSERQRVRQLTLWGTSAPAAVHTQQSLRKLWSVSQAGVSHAITHLTQSGYVLASPWRQGKATEYVLSGVSRLIFD